MKTPWVTKLIGKEGGHVKEEAIYAQLRELAETEPDFEQPSAELSRWLGRLHNAVVACGGGMDIASLQVKGDGLVGVLAKQNVHAIRNILYRTLAKAEQKLPQAVQGGFIAAGDVFEALTVLASALETAKVRALFIDPYAGPEVLSKYAVMVPEGVQVDLLGAEGRIQKGLKPAAEAWVQQYGSKRPLRVRQVEKSLLHDRLLFIDDTDTWDISQSLNALAKRSPATIAKSRPDHAEMKVGAYAPLFEEAESLI